MILHDEKLLVEKRTIPKERARLRRDTHEDEREVSEEIRKERIEVDDSQKRRSRRHPTHQLLTRKTSRNGEGYADPDQPTNRPRSAPERRAVLPLTPQAKAAEVAGQAQEKAQQAAGQAQDKLREQLNQRSSQAATQINEQASYLRSIAEVLREQGKDGPATAADHLAEYAQKVGGYLRDRDADPLLADAGDFGRRQPWAIAAGGLALGICGFAVPEGLKQPALSNAHAGFAARPREPAAYGVARDRSRRFAATGALTPDTAPVI